MRLVNSLHHSDKFRQNAVYRQHLHIYLVIKLTSQKVTVVYMVQTSHFAP
jgi:hypothetical protein